jgi:prevent-host-death family protein
MDVGVRELKAKLSEYLGRAAQGEEIVVTDRGIPIVRLLPYEVSPTIQRGIEEGWIEPPKRRGLVPANPLKGKRSVLEILAEDRA